MAADEKQKERLALAERLLELAEHSSEGEMRSSLSRIYYAVYHVARVVTGKTKHGEIPKPLDDLEDGLGRRFKQLRDLRNKSDYDPGFIEREYGSLGEFRLQFQTEMEAARTLYERLLELSAVEI